MTLASTQQLLLFHTGFSCGVDGPGQRLVVYFKGCNLRCPWCAAPESLSRRSQVMFYPARVSRADLAVQACPRQAVSVGEDGQVRRDTRRCKGCGDFACVEAGISAFERAGEVLDVDSIMEMARRYRSFFGADGGVTLGGGEATCQFDGAAELLERLCEESFHTAMETNGTHPRLTTLYPLLRLLLIDLKHPDSGRCAAATGLGNQQVLENIRLRHEQGGDMVVRIPLVPGFNADESALRAYGEILSAMGALAVQVLPFHRRGAVKWQALGCTMPAADVPEPTDEAVAVARSILGEYGLSIQ